MAKSVHEAMNFAYVQYGKHVQLYLRMICIFYGDYVNFMHSALVFRQNDVNIVACRDKIGTIERMVVRML